MSSVNYEKRWIGGEVVARFESGHICRVLNCRFILHREPAESSGAVERALRARTGV